METKQPVLFISHGAPTNAIEDNHFTRSLVELGESLPRPRAVLVISAHWLTKGTYVTGSARPETIHDFYGFPRELFDIQYAAPGAPDLIAEVAALMPAGVQVLVDNERGLDHGVWSVLLHMFPKADVPVLQLSIDMTLGPQDFFRLGRSIGSLRDSGVLVLGSGNLTHNLGRVQFGNVDGAPPLWVSRFDEWASQALDNGDDDALLALDAPDDGFRENHPTLEHFIPLFYVMGARDDADVISYPYIGFQYSVLSMRCVRFSQARGA